VEQRVAGIVVNTKPAVAREEIERLRAILTNCVRTGPDAQNRTCCTSASRGPRIEGARTSELAP
jgi:hypothetical protein